MSDNEGVIAFGSVIQGPTATYKVFDVDQRGILIPEIFMQTNDSTWYPADRVTEFLKEHGHELMKRFSEMKRGENNET